jgi:hypothetical protein
MGIGMMWAKETEDDRTREGYGDAEIIDTGASPLFGLR